jgi:predicted RNase H-like nuclease (RuvC/YqgF family)
MSAEQTQILEGIRQKIQSAKVRLKEQENENIRLKTQNEDLQRSVRQKQSIIDELEQKNQKLALVKGIMADGENTQDARVQINRIVREIDKCIALLNR